MNVAFIKDAQHDVNDQDRNPEKERQVLHRVLELSRGPLERAADRGRQIARDLADLSDRFAQGHPRPEIEGNGDRRQLAQMVDRQRAGILRDFGERVERHQQSRVRLHIEQR